MTLREQQSKFARMLPRLIDKAYELGFEVTLGDAYRDHRLHGGIGVKKGYGHSKSAHKQRLAIDLNLFKGGVFLQSSEDHKQLGEWWEKQDPLCRWGGRFEDSRGDPAPDGNHYSMFRDGMA